MAETATTNARPRWLVNPTLDLLVGCGAWTLPLLALGLALGESGQATALTGFSVLLLVCNWPHYAATWHRAHAAGIATPRQREAAKLLAAGFVVLVFFLLLNPRFLPWVFTAYLLWSPWHYSGQNFGIAQLLLRRAGAPADQWARRMLLSGFVACYLAWLVPIQALPPEHALLLSLGIERTSAVNATALLLAVAAIGFTGASWRARRAVGWRGAAPLLTMISTQALWFCLPAVQLLRGTPLEATSLALYATALFAFMHCAQYLWITAWAARRSGGAGFSLPRWWLGLGALGVVLFLALPWGLSTATGYDLATALLIMQAAVNLHHFALDGVVWKLRDPAVSSLLVADGLPAPPAVSRWWLFGHTAGARSVRWGGAAVLLVIAGADQVQTWALSGSPAERQLSLAATLAPHDARTHQVRAQLLRTTGKPEAAVFAGMDALALNPSAVASNLLLAELHCDLGDHAQALPHFAAAERNGQIPPRLLARYGNALGLAGQPQQAITVLRKALVYRTSLPEARLGLGEALLLAGRPGEARVEFSAFLAAPGPASTGLLVRAHWRLADALQADGHTDAATRERDAARRRATDAGLGDLVKELERQR